MLNDQALTAPEVASLLHIGKNAVYDMAKDGKIPSYRMGRKLLFARDDIEAYVASKREGGKPETESAVLNALPALDGTLTIGGMGLPASMMAERLQAAGIGCTHVPMTSYEALCSMYLGTCHVALIHLYDQRTNSYNVPYVQRIVPGTPVLILRLVRRWQGLVVAKKNPKAISSWGALLRPDTRIANRERGCGSRVLLDEKLLSMEVVPHTLCGYSSVSESGLAAAWKVGAGIADAAVVGAQIAVQVDGVDFVPLQQEWLDIVVAKTPLTVDLMHQLKNLVSDDAFKSEYARIIHGDPSSFGAVVYEC